MRCDVWSGVAVRDRVPEWVGQIIAEMSQFLRLSSFHRPPYILLRRHYPVRLPSASHPRFLRLQRISTALPHCSLGSIAGASLLQDAAATTAVLVGAYSLVFTFDNLTQRKIIEQNLSRKLVHILSGLLFMASWPIFSNSTEARYFAAFVPLVNCLRLLVNGLAFVNDEGLIKSVSREGNAEELLRGPLFYVLVLIICTTLFWRGSPTGIIPLAMMCGGDGIADIAGRRFGSQKLPFNQQKSWVGSISMFGFGFLISIGMLYYFSSLGYFEVDWSLTLRRVALISVVATMVESFSTSEVIDDNLSVPLVSMVTSFIVFGY